MNVFPLCLNQSKYFDSVDVDKFVYRLNLLNTILLKAEDNKIIDFEGMQISKKIYTNFLFDILDSKYGFEMISEFIPSF